MAQILTTGEDLDLSLCHGVKAARVPAPNSSGARLVPPRLQHKGLAIYLFLHPLCSLLMLSYIIYNRVSNGRGCFYRQLDRVDALMIST
jgi:hypothetical protein